MTSPQPAACAHDLGRGTTVCLRCRQERRDAERARQQRLLGLSGVAVMGLIGIYVIGASAASAIRANPRSDSTRVAPRASVVASSESGGRDVALQGAVTPVSALTSAPVAASVSVPVSAAVSAPVQAAVTTPVTPVTALAPVSRSPVAFIVREGRTTFPDSIIAERGGDSVIVDFDTPGARTRRRDKFEDVVRRTLPLVYGATVDSVLRAIPAGGIIGSVDLLTELPRRGAHLRVAAGWTLDLWPETRPGQDGPLVVGYRARMTRDGSLR